MIYRRFAKFKKPLYGRKSYMKGLVVAFMLIIGIVLASSADSVVAYAKGMETPKLGEWKNVTPKNPVGDGAIYQIKWKPVKGDDAQYEIKFYTKETPDQKKWDTFNEYTIDCKAQMEFSYIYKFKVKVRTVKRVNGKFKHGKWATSKTVTIK